MSQDFVRRLPDAGLVFEQRYSWFDRVHLDLVLLILLTVISIYGMLILYSAVGQQTAPLYSQAMKFFDCHSDNVGDGPD